VRPHWSSGPVKSACVRSGRDNTHALRPTPEPGLLVPVTVQIADGRDGLRGNVVPHHLPQVHLTVVSMESTAQYWKPVWEALERYWKPICEKREVARRKSGTLHLAQALSNRGRRGRKRDFPDAERLVKRLVAQELTLSFVPDAEQRLWRTVMRKKYQLRCDRIRLQNQLESLLEEAHIKLSSFVSDLLGLSAQRMLKAMAQGETSPATFRFGG